MQTFTIIGMGKVGGAMALSLNSAGFAVETLVSKHKVRTEWFAAELNPVPKVLEPSEFLSVDTGSVLITTQDSEIENVAAKLAELNVSSAELFVFHMSGSLSSKSLEVLRKRGFHTGSLHPLVSISDPVRGAKSIEGAFFAVEGDPEAVKFGNEIVKRIGGEPFEIETASKTLYHAAAVVACGHLAALVHTAQKMLVECGLSEEKASTVLMPLIQSTVSNLSDLPPSRALTGPFQRGDAGTIGKHLEKIAEMRDSSIEQVYRTLGLVSLELAESEGTDKEKLDRIKKLILLDKNISK